MIPRSKKKKKRIVFFPKKKWDPLIFPDGHLKKKPKQQQIKKQKNVTISITVKSYRNRIEKLETGFKSDVWNF